MSPRPENLRLRRLLDDFLKPFSDIAGDCLTEEIEKDLLIALSQVFRQVKQWTHDFDSDEEVLAGLDAEHRECSVSSISHLDKRLCLAKIVGELMFLLAVSSRHAQHLAGNILVAISELLLTSDSGWDDFVHLLCLSLELSISNSLMSSSEFKTSYLDHEPSTSRTLLNSKLESANWSVVAAIFRVLRNMQKYLNQESDYDITKAYVDSVSSIMSNIPWDTLREIYVGHSTDEEALQGSAKDALLKSKAITAFFGNFIQFLCSLVPQSSFLDDDRVNCKIIDLVPKLAAWCLPELRTPHHVRKSHYLRHKLLMLMVKLSSSLHIKQTTLVTWMDMVHGYFEDLLLQPISGVESDRNDFLEGSPFCTSILDTGTQNMFSRHLQRLSVFIFFKCSLSSFDVNSCTSESNLGSECPSESIGLMKFREWLQAQVDADILENGELYFGGCVRFTSSFLQLFLHEDDILFEMLLQLFRVPFYLERRIINNENLPEVKNRLVFLASDLFNPIHLFHLFLAEIHYDHQVLLDYLISKDTGSSSAEYLLRSLRIVCNSWSLFVDFPGVEEDYLGHLSPKRQKVFKEHEEVHACKKNRLPFASARDCLISLKNSIDSLNQKNLFPYNPQVLLRRLTRFQELCITQ